MKQGKEPKWERTYNLLWQMAAVPIAKALQVEIGFDFIHHLTWGGIRAPTLLGSLGAPLIIGPLGGGETSPRTLRDRLPLRGRFVESLRDFSTATVELNPYVRRGLGSASVIFARTEETRKVLSQKLQEKTVVQMELGVSRAQINAPRKLKSEQPRLLYAGRLLYWKGVHVAIEAMASLVKKMPNARLSIVGSGPEEARLVLDAKSRGLDSNVEFIPWMKQEDFLRLHDTHDLLVFPSFHDSTGWVVLEALCNGLPVACLDLGGPKDIVTPDSGIVVSTRGLSTSEVATRLAEQIENLMVSPSEWERLSAGAIARAHDFLLSDQITKLYREASRLTRQGVREKGPETSGCHADRALPHHSEARPNLNVAS
jgi:glycosyltransferase involved in cell wall biosynthesis